MCMQGGEISCNYLDYLTHVSLPRSLVKRAMHGTRMLSWQEIYSTCVTGGGGGGVKCAPERRRCTEES